MVQHSHLCMTIWKTIALTIWAFVGKVMSLLFKMLSRFVIAFLPRSKRLSNFMATVTVHSDCRAQEEKICHCFHFSPSFCHEVKGPDATILVFLILICKAAFLLSSFTLIKRLFSSYSLSAMRVMSSSYLRLLIFLPSVLTPAWASSSPTFCMMNSAYKLNKQGVNIQPWHTPLPILK